MQYYLGYTVVTIEKLLNFLEIAVPLLNNFKPWKRKFTKQP